MPNFASRIKIKCNNYLVFGSGILKKRNTYSELIQNKGAFDNVIIIARNIDSKTYLNKKVSIVVKNCPKELSDSLSTQSSYIFNLFEKLFGLESQSIMTIFCNFPNIKSGNGGFARESIIYLSFDEINLSTYQTIAHEISHLWWHNGNVLSWDDWLNEAFADYSSLMYIREKNGLESFSKMIESYRKNTINAPPIWGLANNSQFRNATLYMKGSLVLFEFELRVGNERFISFLKEISSQKIKTTTEFLDCLEKNFTKDDRQWFEEKLKT